MLAGDKILITGAGGMVAGALVRELNQNGFKNLILLTRKDCDLSNRAETVSYFQKAKPQFVFHLAAKVGGIQANINDPVGFLAENLLINTHVLEACHKASVTKTLVLGSSCIYPRECPQPMKEEYLLTGPVEPTNEGYALSKIAALKLALYYQNQFKMKLVCPMPCNLYGPGDHFDFEKSHVLSALVRRFTEAKRNGVNEVTLWGTGTARREFLHVEDCAKGMLFSMQKISNAEHVNLGTGVDYSIKELAQMIAVETGFTGKINWDTTRPDGMPRKCLDVTKMTKLGFEAKIGIAAGIKSVAQDFEKRFPK